MAASNGQDGSPTMKSLCVAVLLFASVSLSLEASPWFDAIKSGDTATVTKMLDAGADLEEKNEWEGTALAEAIWSAKQEIIPLLLSHGANPNTSGQYGTPLCLAIEKWDTIAIRMLLDDPRTDANLERRDGMKPLDLIRFSDSKFNAAIADGLIKRGASINGANSKGETPLMSSCWVGSEKWASFLVSRGADIHAKKANGETAYVIAARRGQIEIMKILEARGGKVPVLLRSSVGSKTPLSPAEKWALATGAILNQRNGRDHEALIPESFSGEQRATAIRILKEDWGVNDRDGLIRQLAALESSTDDPSYLAWNLCRYTNVAQWGVQAGYLDERTAWEGMLRVARQIQGTYKSWAEMAESYMTGRRRWARNIQLEYKREVQKAHAQMEYIAQLLLNTQDPNSPWTKNKWDTDLGVPLMVAQKPIEAHPRLETPQPGVKTESGEWKSANANCALKVPEGAGWTQQQSNDPMRLSLRHGDRASFHMVCSESSQPEITAAMTASAKANSKAHTQASGNRSEVVSGDWTTFRGVRAYQWIEKQFPPQKPPYFRAQLMFNRGGRSYLVMASSSMQDPLKDPLIDPLLSAIRFLDEK
jgi:hypothetical protein